MNTDEIRFVSNTFETERCELTIHDLDEVSGASWLGWLVSLTGNPTAGTIIDVATSGGNPLGVGVCR